MGTGTKQYPPDLDGATASLVESDARADVIRNSTLSIDDGTLFDAPRAPAPPVPTQEGPLGIRYDFNGGARISLPTGKWRVRIEDAASGFAYLACDIDGGAITSTHERHIAFRIRIWGKGKRAPLLDHTMELAGRQVALALPVRTLADFIEWLPHIERFRKKHDCRLECLMGAGIANMVRRHYPDILFHARSKPPSKDLYASFGPGLFTGSGPILFPLPRGGREEAVPPAAVSELFTGSSDLSLSVCRPEALERPLPAAFIHAAAAFCAGDFRTFDQRLAWLSQRAASMPENTPETDAWRGEVEFLRVLAARNDIEAMSTHCRHANALLGGRPSRLPVPESPWTLGSPSVLFLFHRRVGGLEREVALMREYLPNYHRLAGGHGAGGEQVMEAEALYHQGDFAGAATAERRAGAAAMSGRQAGTMLATHYLRMRLSLFEGDWPSARRALADMRGRIRDENDHGRRNTVDLCESRLWTALGRTDGVPEWIRRGVGGEDRFHPFSGGYYYVVHGGVLLTEGRWTEATGLYSWLLEAGTYADNTLLAIYARICLAAAHHSLGKTKEARDELRRAGDSAFPDGVIMPFVENWRHIAAITGTAIADAPQTLFETAATWTKRCNGIIARYFSPDGPPLTDRELELARLAAAGKKYREIASEVHLAYGTVKRAFATIYGKLGISSVGELRRYLQFKDLS